MASERAPPAQTHAAHVELLRSPAERVAAALEPGPATCRPLPPGGRAAQAALPPRRHLPRGAGRAGHAAISRRDERAEDLRRDTDHVPENVSRGKGGSVPCGYFRVVVRLWSNDVLLVCCLLFFML